MNQITKQNLQWKILGYSQFLVFKLEDSFAHISLTVDTMETKTIISLKIANKKMVSNVYLCHSNKYIIHCLDLLSVQNTALSIVKTKQFS